MRRVTLVLLAAAAIAGAGASPSAGAVQPYGAGDAGGFRNIMPPGAAGTDTAIDFAAFNATGARPAHSNDQLAPYRDLLYASPTLTDADVGRFFKDATFGAREVASSEQPRPGLTIVRDAGYDVPHVYGATRGDVMFGTGWVGAEDRLFLMDILRHTGRAELSSFAGGNADNRQQDRDQWTVAPYTEADLQGQIDSFGSQYGAAGTRAVDDLLEYVAGINAYIAKVRLDPTRMPAEYALLNVPLRDWTPTDVIATASLVGGIYGKGGGEELRSAMVLEAAQARFGARAGRSVWSDLRLIDDPKAPTTLTKRFPYETAVSPFARRGLALPDPGSVRFDAVGPPLTEPAQARGDGGFVRGLLPARGASNALLVRAGSSEGGHPIAVMGPEVDFYQPQILLEEDLHGPGFDARGASFPGVNLYVQLGHGRNHAWSATSAYGDNVDTFAVPLCDEGHYRYRGSCRPIERLVRHNAWTPNAADMTPPGGEDLVAQRTDAGLVEAHGTVAGKPVLFVRRRTTYRHEADSGLGFSDLNDPALVSDPAGFKRAVEKINLSFNWFYVDQKHIAYFGSGNYPRRAKGVSPDFPVDGSGAHDWRGLIASREHPQAVDVPLLVNWNNRPAPGFAGADDDFGESAPERSQLLSEKLVAATAHGRRATVAQVVSAMEETATQDLRGAKLVGPLDRALGHPSNSALRSAIELLRRWAATGAHRRDLDRDGHYDDDAAVTLMDAWWPKLVEAEFRPAMGEALWGAIQAVKPVGDSKGGAASTPEFCCSWYAYVARDLTKLFGRRTPGGPSRTYCAGGSRKRCRALLRRTLVAALKVTHADLYGHEPDCVDRKLIEASCHDEERPIATAAIDPENFPFAQRPTFQQVVQVGAGR